MGEFRNVFVCTECGYTSPKWMGKCPECNAWNSMSEDAVTNKTFKEIEKATPKKTKKIGSQKPSEHISCGISEVDLVFGGGIASSALTLLAGAPGIGKSTLCLQIASNVDGKTLIISAEESEGQVAARASRLGSNEEINLISETNLDVIISTLRKEKPKVAIIDSVQTVFEESVSGYAGSITQTKNAAEKLLQVAHESGIGIVLIGHVTKQGDIAGPRTLEHLVDAVFLLEGDRHQNFRILRGIKNRFGSTDEIGILEMTGKGMMAVKNPSEYFLSGRHPSAIGSVITVTTEGNRSFLVEIQALTATTSFGYPKRTVSGMPMNRLDILVAVLQRYTGMKLYKDDVFLNVAGGFSLQERAGDLAAALAIASSKKKISVPDKLLALGEVGLSGELRPVPYAEKRLKEAEKIGFETVVLPKGNVPKKTKLKIIECATVAEALSKVLK